MKFNKEIIDIISTVNYHTVFTLEEDDPTLTELKKINFEGLEHNTKLQNMVICNYYDYTMCDQGDNGFNNDSSVNLYFDSKYDGSCIKVSCSGDKNDATIAFSWQTGDTHMERDKFHYLQDKIQEEVIPELITKLLAL